MGTWDKTNFQNFEAGGKRNFPPAYEILEITFFAQAHKTGLFRHFKQFMSK